MSTYDIIRNLHDNLSAVEVSKEELETAQYDIQQALSGIEDYQEAVQCLIDSLEELPELSVSVSVDIDIDV